MGPFHDQNGLIVPKTPCWMANEALGPWKEIELGSLYVLIPSISASFAIQQGVVVLCDRLVQKAY